MLLARALVLRPSGRALLAVAAVALSVAYAVIASGALSGLSESTAAAELKGDPPGWVIVAPEGEGLDPGAYGPDAIAQLRGTHPADGYPIATILPWHHGPKYPAIGPHAPEWGPPEWAGNITPTPNITWYAPPDALVLDPDNFSIQLPDHPGTAALVFVPGETRPVGTAPSIQVVPWEGARPFFERGAAEVGNSLALVGVATALVGALIVAGIVRLEVLAKARELATLEALGGPRRVRRVVLARTAVLVGTGVAVGLAVSAVALAVAEARYGAGAFRPDPLTVLIVVLVTLVAGLVLGGTSGLRALRTAPRTARGALATVRRFPGRPRYLLVTPRVFPALFTAVLVSGTLLQALLAAGAVPHTLFSNGEGGEGLVISEGGGNPLRRSADLFLGSHIAATDAVAEASPETLAPTVVQGHPVFVRGIDWDQWSAWHDGRLTDGALPAKFAATEGISHAEATIGDRLQRVTDIQIGDEIIVPLSYVPGTMRLSIVGTHTAPGPEADELLVTLDTAAALASIAPDRVGMIRVRPADPGAALSDVVPTSGIEVADVRISPTNPVPFGTAEVQIDLVNFGRDPTTRVLNVRLNDQLAATLTAFMPGRTSHTETVEVIVPAPEPGTGGRLRIEVNPTRETDYGDSELRVQGPSKARPGEPINISVVGADGHGVVADLLLDGASIGRTAADGLGSIEVPEPRVAVITARADDGRTGGTEVRVVPPEGDGQPFLVVRSLVTGDPLGLNDTHYTMPVRAAVTNIGGAQHNGTITWLVDGEEVATTDLRLGTGGQRVIETQLVLSYGPHTIGILGRTITRDVQPPGSGGGDTATPLPTPTTGGQQEQQEVQRTVEEVIAERRQQTAAASGDPAVEFLEETFDEFGVTAGVVLLATLVHGAVLVVVGVRRETAERAPVRVAYAALGAEPRQVSNRAVRDTVLAALPAVILAIIVGIVALEVLAYIGVPRAFGHVLPTDGALQVFLRIAGGYLLIATVTAALVPTDRTERANRSTQRQTPEDLLIPGGRQHG